MHRMRAPRPEDVDTTLLDAWFAGVLTSSVAAWNLADLERPWAAREFLLFACVCLTVVATMRVVWVRDGRMWVQVAIG